MEDLRNILRDKTEPFLTKIATNAGSNTFAPSDIGALKISKKQLSALDRNGYINLPSKSYDDEDMSYYICEKLQVILKSNTQ